MRSERDRVSERGGKKTETEEHPRSRESEKEWPERDVRKDPVGHLASKFLKREWWVWKTGLEETPRKHERKLQHRD